MVIITVTSKRPQDCFVLLSDVLYFFTFVLTILKQYRLQSETLEEDFCIVHQQRQRQKEYKM